MTLGTIRKAVKNIRSALAKRPVKQFSEDGIRSTAYRPGRPMIRRLKYQWQQYVQRIRPYPQTFRGRGIVICAGGVEYFTCAWVNISLLRKQGCSLPIEVWYTGEELSTEVIGVVGKLGVVCRNSKDHTHIELPGYVLKPFSILHSSFREVLFLDADNNCLRDPEYLFDSAEYARTGAIFWPDCWKTAKSNPIWEVTGSTDYDSYEQESGQILIDKERCWKEINLTLHFNMQHEHFYRMLLGDKDTFRFAWMALGTAFHMIRTPVGFCGFTSPRRNFFYGMSMVQHDHNGAILFIHRNLLKWDVTKEDERVWNTVKRFKKDARKRIFRSRAMGRNKKGNIFTFVDIDGDVEAIPFREVAGNLEDCCLEMLRELRSSGFYSRFLMDSYLMYSRPMW